MIARYSRPAMAAVWTDQNRYLKWLEVEAVVCAAWAEKGVIPTKDWTVLNRALKALTKKGGVDPARVEFHEATTKHDVIAFTTAVAEELGPISRYVHFGLTSSDVVDTALSMMIAQSGELLLEGIQDIQKVLKKRALEFEKVATIGRTHGIYAEPTSFGLKFLGWWTEWKRNEQRLRTTLEEIRFGKLSGAVGASGHIAPEFEQKILKNLGLKREPVSTQVLPRDRHAQLMSTLALLGGSIERIAVELRHLQRSEVAEVREGFSKGQKGSSAMPHKRNPISSENLTGGARLLRGYAQSAFENQALWHERDISHSSVERVVFPDATILLDYMIHRMTGILENLEVNRAQIQANLERAGKTSFSGHVLLALIEKGAVREDAYRWVQACALGAGDFEENLTKSVEIRKYLSKQEIKKQGQVEYQLRNVKAIYQKAFSSE